MHRRQRALLIGLLLGVSAFPADAAEDAGRLLSSAQAARDRGDCRKAIAFARQALRSAEQEGEAFHLIGLCRLEANKAEAALAAFDRASKSVHPPSKTLLAFDRARAEELMNRDDEAEAHYLEASLDDGRLGALAHLQLILLALRQADVGAARDHFDLALAHPESAHLKDELALVAVQIEEEARGVAVVPQAHQNRILHQDDRGLGLTLAQRSTEAIVGEEEGPWRGSLLLGFGVGFDSNVQYLPRTGDLFGTEREGMGAGGDAYATVLFALGGAYAPARRYDVGIDYAFFQMAYQRPDYDPFAIQEHSLSLTQNVHLGRMVTLSLPLIAEASFSGLQQTYALFQATGGAFPELSLRWGPLFRTRFQAGWSRRRVVDQALAFLDGQRWEASVSQSVSWANWLLSLRFRYRRDLLGARVQEGAWGADGCEACNDLRNATPYSHDGRSVSLLLSSPFAKRLRLAVSATYEERPFLYPNRVFGRDAEGDRSTLESWRRFDRRVFLAPSVHVVLWREISLVARYTFSTNVSNVDGEKTQACEDRTTVCHPQDLQDRNYRKHAASVDLEYAWM